MNAFYLKLAKISKLLLTTTKKIKPMKQKTGTG